MSRRTSTRARALRAAAPVAVLALALTACGGSGSGDESTDKAQQGSSESKPKGDGAEEAPEEEAGPLQAGEAATAAFKEDDAKITYEIAAQKVDLSTEAEAQKMVDDPKDAKGLVAATAHVKFTVKSGGVVKSSPDVGMETEILADGAPGARLMFASEDAPGCDDSIDIENWKAGQSYTLCQTYMVPVNSKEIQVQFPEEGGATHSWAFPTK